MPVKYKISPKKNVEKNAFRPGKISGKHFSAIEILRETYSALSGKKPEDMGTLELSIKNAIIEEVYTDADAQERYSPKLVFEEIYKILSQKEEWEAKEEELYELFTKIIFLRLWDDKFRNFFQNMEDVIASTIQLDFNKRVALTDLLKDQNNVLNYGAVFLNLIVEKLQTSVVSAKAVNTLFSSVPGMVMIVTNHTGNIRFINELGEQLVGMSNAELSGKPISTFLSDYAQLEKSLAEGKEIKNTMIDLVAPGAPPRRIPVLLTVPTPREDATEVKEIIFNLTTEPFKKQDMIFDLTKESHDKIGPLNSIAGITSLLKKKYIDPESQLLFSMLEKSVVKLKSTAEDTLNAMISGETVLRTEPVYFSQILNEILDLLKFSDGFSEMEFIQDIKYEGAFESNPKLIHSLFLNFITNAIKYRNKSIAHPFVKISVCKAEEQLRIEISDNGMGISKKEQQNLFQEGFRTQWARSSGIEGHGVGLFLVKQSIAKLGGKVEVSGKPGKGVVFTIYLPITK